MTLGGLSNVKNFVKMNSNRDLRYRSFCRGYLLTQVAGGVWADRFGGKKVLGFGVVWWSIATFLTPIAAKLGLIPLLIVRACMGIGEGVAMPAMNNMLSRWVEHQHPVFILHRHH